MTDQTPLTPEDLDAIESRANAATPGPWYRLGPPWYNNWYDRASGMYVPNPPVVIARFADPHIGEIIFETPDIRVWEVDDDGNSPWPDYSQAAANVDFVIRARQDIPRLVAQVRELEAR